MAVKRTYRLNLKNYGNLPAIMLSQYDEGYALEFEIRDGMEAAGDLSGYAVTLKGTRYDTLSYSFTGTISTNVLTFVIDTTMTACAGKGTAEIVITGSNNVVFATFNMPVFVEKAAVPDGTIDADVERAKEIAEQIQQIVDTAAEQTTSGAERIVADLEEDVSELKSGLNKLTTATAEDVGKALKAKTVADGKVTEWEFGEAGGDSEIIEEHTKELAMLLTKTPKPAPVPTEITQCVDISKATQGTGSYAKQYYNVKVEMPWLGRYDMNPSNNSNLRFFYMQAYDKDGNLLTSYRNGNENNSIGCPEGGYAVKIDERTIKTYKANGTLDWTWTADGDIAYLYSSARWKGCLGDSTEAGQLIGVTFAGASETYVPYDPIDPDIPVEYDYSPNSDYADAIQEYYAENGFIDKTLSTEGSAADAKTVGDELYDRMGITFDTVNGWIRPGNGDLITNTGNTATDFIPVTPGEVIRVNRPALQTLTENAYYNASKSFVSAVTTPSNVTDLTIPSGVYYVRFSDYNAGMVGFSVERTGLWTRIRDAITEASGEAEYRNLIEQSRYGTKVLTLLHFSDLHMDATTMGYINTFRTKYAEFLDDTIQTGDVSNGFSDNWGTLVGLGLGDCLGVIGNHEALGDSKNSATQQELYEKYIEPYISGWNVTQPTGVDDSTSEHYCANYYYKDYASATIRLIVLDTQKWSSAQLTWFTSTLASARTAGYAVVVASHVIPSKITITDCNFSARYASGGNVTHAFPTSDAPLVTDDAASAVNDFITAGGEFVIWIGGHEHADIFGVFTDYPNITAYMIDKASINRETPGAARLSGEKNQHAFNVMSVVRDGKLLKIVRIGEDVDGLMRGKHVFCYNYNTKTVISQW